MQRARIVVCLVAVVLCVVGTELFGGGGPWLRSIRSRRQLGSAGRDTAVARSSGDASCRCVLSDTLRVVNNDSLTRRLGVLGDGTSWRVPHLELHQNITSADGVGEADRVWADVVGAEVNGTIRIVGASDSTGRTAFLAMLDHMRLPWFRHGNSDFWEVAAVVKSTTYKCMFRFASYLRALGSPAKAKYFMSLDGQLAPHVLIGGAMWDMLSNVTHPLDLADATYDALSAINMTYGGNATMRKPVVVMYVPHAPVEKRPPAELPENPSPKLMSHYFRELHYVVRHHLNLHPVRVATTRAAVFEGVRRFLCSDDGTDVRPSNIDLRLLDPHQTVDPRDLAKDGVHATGRSRDVLALALQRLFGERTYDHRGVCRALQCVREPDVVAALESRQIVSTFYRTDLKRPKKQHLMPRMDWLRLYHERVGDILTAKEIALLDIVRPVPNRLKA